MTAQEFRRMALSLAGTTAQSHMGHPDFRVAGRIFATLGFPGRGWGMVKLTPEQQELFVRSQPKAFKPVNGAWGRAGVTNVALPTAKKSAVREALTMAWENTQRPRR